MLGNIEIIKQGHDLYDKHPLYNGESHPSYGATIDGNLRKSNIVRFNIKLETVAEERFRRLAIELVNRKLSGEDFIKEGALLMLGYVPENKRVEEHFCYGVSPDIAKTQKTHLGKAFRRTLDLVIDIAESEEKHDGAILISPRGELYHCGVLLDPCAKKTVKAYGYRGLYELKNEIKTMTGLELKGRTRTTNAILHSMLFLNALYASISKDKNPEKDYFVQNGGIEPIIQ